MMKQQDKNLWRSREPEIKNREGKAAGKKRQEINLVPLPQQGGQKRGLIEYLRRSTIDARSEKWFHRNNS